MFLTEKADLAAIPPGAAGEEKGRLAFQTLSTRDGRSQVPLRAYLDGVE